MLETRRAACGFALKFICKKESICFVQRYLFSLSSSVDLLQGLSMEHHFFTRSFSSACIWKGMRFWVGAIPSRTASCSLTDPCKGSAGCRNKLYWWKREIRCIDKVKLLMPPLSCSFRRRCFLCGPSSLLSALKIKAPEPQFSVVSHGVGEASAVLMACAAAMAPGFGA